MTQALFQVNWRQHVTMSERHKRYVALAARQTSESDRRAHLEERAARADISKALGVLERSGKDNPPMPGDEWQS